jgi:hypothetical protein
MYRRSKKKQKATHSAMISYFIGFFHNKI